MCYEAEAYVAQQAPVIWMFTEPTLYGVSDMLAYGAMASRCVLDLGVKDVNRRPNRRAPVWRPIYSASCNLALVSNTYACPGFVLHSPGSAVPVCFPAFVRPRM